VPAEDAMVIDSTATTIEQVFDQVMLEVTRKGLV
jgi:cytidylate kinase